MVCCVVMGCCVVALALCIDCSGMRCRATMECSNGMMCSHGMLCSNLMLCSNYGIIKITPATNPNSKGNKTVANRVREPGESMKDTRQGVYIQIYVLM